jgi:alkylation response protein AidB-like acyl-CoA dehydrogenase
MNHEQAELKGVEEFAVECSILKVFVSDFAQHTADEGIQIYGGMGFSEDTPMEAWRDQEFPESMKEPTKSTDFWL